MTRDQHLLAQLRSYDAADAVESDHRRAMLDLLERSRSPFARDQFVPGHFTASCFILDGEGRVLLHHHRRLGRWLQMGGHVEGDETTECAALREAFEESGLDDLQLDEQILDLDIHAIPAGRGEPDHHHFDVRYAARTSRPERMKIDQAESTNLAWVSLQQAADLMPGDESRRVLRKLGSLLRERSLT